MSTTDPSPSPTAHPRARYLYDRGELPCEAWIRTHEGREGLLQVPGTRIGPNGHIQFAPDMLPLIAARPDATVTRNALTTFAYGPFVPEFGRWDEGLRPYQVEAVDFLAPKRGAFICDPCQTGKTASVIRASIAARHHKVLVLTTSFIALNWLEEIGTWAGENALLLGGRGQGGRQICLECETMLAGCKRCRYTGTRPIHNVDEEQALRQFRWVVCPYDCLRAHEARLEGSGRKYERSDLPGRADQLHAANFDLIILDESHLLAGDSKRTRSVKRTVGHPTKRTAVWAVTGTPIRSFAKDLFSQLDIVTGGLFGSRREFEQRYCEGHYNQYGWSANGRSPLVDVELSPRLHALMIKRERKDLLPHLPPTQTKVVRIDPPKGWRAQTEFDDKPSASVMGQACKETFEVKWPAAFEQAEQFLAEGDKVVLYTWHRDTARQVAARLQTHIQGRRGSALRAKGAEVFCAEGTTPQARNRMARKFREHQGAAVWVSTMEASMMGVPLKGAVAFLYLDLHWSPDVLEQSGDRASQAESNGVIHIFYIANGTIDEAVLPVLLPKLKTQLKITGDQTAAQLEDTLGTKETLDEIWARHTKHLRARKEA